MKKKTVEFSFLDFRYVFSRAEFATLCAVTAVILTAGALYTWNGLTVQDQQNVAAAQSAGATNLWPGPSGAIINAVGR
ncbi:MAG: hypothetical protein PHS62_02450 [Patescibacteria group bacterium]|nr:hypothetical protein [Patescibacteria group bacterium]